MAATHDTKQARFIKTLSTPSVVAVADARAIALADDHLPRPLLLIARDDGRPAVGTQERPLLARRLLHEMLLARAAGPQHQWPHGVTIRHLTTPGRSAR